MELNIEGLKDLLSAKKKDYDLKVTELRQLFNDDPQLDAFEEMPAEELEAQKGRRKH